MKTLDQIWNENFEFLPAGDLTGYSGSCGHDLGGDDGDNQKNPLDTIADKLISIAGDPAMSDARKQQLMDRLIDDFFNGNTGGGIGPIAPGPSPNPVRYPNNTNPTSQPSTDPSDGPIPPAYGVPDFPDARDDVDLGGQIDLDIDNDGNVDVRLTGITPDKAKLLKNALAAAMAAKNAACAKNKSNPNTDPTTGDPKPEPPTPTTPLVTPAPEPPVMNKPFRPFNPNLRPTPPGGIYGSRPVLSTPTYP